VVFNAGKTFATTSAHAAELFERTWRVATFGDFWWDGKRPAAGASRRRHHHFYGRHSELRGKAPFTAFASAKAGLRSLAQSMGREFGRWGFT